jgi:hypothetical protein
MVSTPHVGTDVFKTGKSQGRSDHGLAYGNTPSKDCICGGIPGLVGKEEVVKLCGGAGGGGSGTFGL